MTLYINSMRTTAKFTLLLLVVLVIVTGSFALAVGLPVSETNPVPPAPTTPAPVPLHQDPEVVAHMQELGLDYSKLNLYYGPDPDMPSSHEASFTGPNNIYLDPSLNPSEIDIALSHEYIHYVQLVDPSAATFNGYLDNLLARDSWFYNRMEKYRQPGFCEIDCDIHTEAEAIACTEIPDRVLRNDFIAWCNAQLPHRYTLL
jgi:hypothetical protein